MNPPRPFPVITKAAIGSYFAQGIGPGLLTAIVMPTLAQRGFSLEAQAGLLGSGVAPWLIKMPIALALDHPRWRGKRSARVALALGQTMLIVGLAGLVAGLTREVTLTWLVGAWIFFNFGSVLQDTATDALILDLGPSVQRGVVNALALWSRAIGQVAIGGWLLGALVPSIAAATLAGASAGILALVLLVTFPRHLPTMAPPSQSLALAAALVALAQDRLAWRAGLAALTVYVVSAAFEALSANLLFVRLKLTLEAYQTWLLPIAVVTTLAGYVLSLHLVKRVATRRLVYVASLGLGGLWAGFGLALDRLEGVVLPFLCAYVVGEALLTAVFVTAIHTELMRRSHRDCRATHFAFYVTAINLSKIIGLAIAPPLHSWLHDQTFLLVGGACQIGLAWLYLWSFPPASAD